MIPGFAGIIADAGPPPVVFTPSFVVVNFTAQLVPIPVGATFVDIYAIDGGMDGQNGLSSVVGGSGGDGGACFYQAGIAVGSHTGVYCNPGINRVFGSGGRGVSATVVKWDASGGTTITLSSNNVGGTGGLGSGLGNGFGGGGGGAGGDSSAGGNGSVASGGIGGPGGPHGSGVVSGHSGDGGTGGDSNLPTSGQSGSPWGGGGGGAANTGSSSGSGQFGGVLLHFT